MRLGLFCAFIVVASLIAAAKAKEEEKEAQPWPPYGDKHTVYWTRGSRNFSYDVMMTKDDVAAAYIIANNAGMEDYGWDAVYVEGNRDLFKTDPEIVYYAAGYAEGRSTAERIYQFVENVIAPRVVSRAAMDWIRTNIAYMRNMSRIHSSESAYWRTVGCTLSQVDGIYEGYSSTAPPSRMIFWMDVYMASFDSEVSSVEKCVGNLTVDGAVGKERADEEDHCSAIIKHVVGKDLYVAHNTWGRTMTMLRQSKVYNISDRGGVLMSSYPATVSSGDDWYVLKNGLVVQETTIQNYNKTAMKLVPTHSVPEFIRVTVANELADEWKANGPRSSAKKTVGLTTISS